MVLFQILLLLLLAQMLDLGQASLLSCYVVLLYVVKQTL